MSERKKARAGGSWRALAVSVVYSPRQILGKKIPGPFRVRVST